MPSSACQKCARSEEHTSELQSHSHLVCRLLLEKKIQEGWTAASRSRSHLLLGAPDRLCTTQPAVPPRHLPPRARQRPMLRSFLFFFNDAAPTEIYTFPHPAALRI